MIGLLSGEAMQPLALVLNIAIVVGIIGIVVYWVRRFAVFLGYKPIQPDVLQIAELLKAEPLRDGSDVVVARHYCGVSPPFPLLSQIGNPRAANPDAGPAA